MPRFDDLLRSIVIIYVENCYVCMVNIGIEIALRVSCLRVVVIMIMTMVPMVVRVIVAMVIHLLSVECRVVLNKALECWWYADKIGTADVTSIITRIRMLCLLGCLIYGTRICTMV